MKKTIITLFCALILLSGCRVATQDAYTEIENAYKNEHAKLVIALDGYNEILDVLIVQLEDEEHTTEYEREMIREIQAVIRGTHKKLRAHIN